MIAYGPTQHKALAKLDAKTLAQPADRARNAKDALQFNVRFWADQGEELEKRFMHGSRNDANAPGLRRFMSTGNVGSPVLQSALRRQARARTLLALALAAPLLLFLLLTFLVPIGTLLMRAVENPEVARALPRTVAALDRWDRASSPPDAALRSVGGRPVRRSMSNPLPAPWLAASTLKCAARARWSWAPSARCLCPKGSTPQGCRARLIEIDPTVGRTLGVASDREERVALYARLSARLGGPAARFEGRGRIDAGRPVGVSAHLRAHLRHQPQWSRCFACSLGYPLAWWLSTLPERRANLLMILVLVPFWTSILVRVAAWIVLLQSDGLVNQSLAWARADRPAAGAAVQPHRRRDRHGAHPAAVHDPAAVQRHEGGAARIRARRRVARQPPVRSVFRVYVPQTYPGVGAGCLLVFILAIGYYVTPALLGGPDDQMLSYTSPNTPT